MQITMDTPPLDRAGVLAYRFLFRGFNFQSTAKTAKIGPLENFPLYGSMYAVMIRVGAQAHPIEGESASIENQLVFLWLLLQ